jgi:hypothetical protein
VAFSGVWYRRSRDPPRYSVHDRRLWRLSRAERGPLTTNGDLETSELVKHEATTGSRSTKGLGRSRDMAERSRPQPTIVVAAPVGVLETRPHSKKRAPKRARSNPLGGHIKLRMATNVKLDVARTASVRVRDGAQLCVSVLEAAIELFEEGARGCG